jgi:hypothetical protein
MLLPSVLATTTSLPPQPLMSPQQGAVSGATGITSSGTITFSGLTNNGPVYTSAGGVLNSETRLSPVRGGTGLDGSAAANGSLVIGNGSGFSLNPLTGTANQVIVTNGAGSITLSTPQDIATSSTPSFAALTLSNTTNQLVLGTTNTITISSLAPAASRTATIPALAANDTFVFLAQAQTLINKTIGATGLNFSGANPDITTETGTNEDFTISPDGTGEIILSNIAQLGSLPAAPLNATTLCRDDVTHEIVQCPANAASVTLQQAYNAGNTISATNGDGNIDFTLAALNSTQFTLTNAGTAASAFVINDSNAANHIALEIQSGGVQKLTLNENGNVITSGTIQSGAITTSGTLTFSNVATDITTGTDESLTITPNGIGEVILGKTTQLSSLPAPTGNAVKTLCRDDVTNEITQCSANAANISLQLAYDSGNTITTTDGRDIAFTLYDESSDSGTATSFTLENAGTASAFIINDTNGATNQTAFEIQSGGSPTLTIDESGSLVTSGTITQNYSNTTGTAANFNITNSASAGSTAVQGLGINLVGTNNGAGSNINTGINFGNVTARTNNTFNGITFGTGFNNFLTSSTINISAAGSISGVTGITYASGAYNFDQSSSTGTFQTGSGNATLNGNTTVATNKNLTLASGTGTLNQTFVNAVTSAAQNLSVTNSNVSSTGANVQGVSISLVGTNNSNASANTITGINFPNATTGTNNTINGITFGTGFDNFLTSPTINITAAGAVTGATGVTSSGTITFSGLTNNGPVYTTAGGVLNSETRLSPVRGGTGVDGSSAANGSLLIGNSTGFSLSTLTGTANQVIVTNGAGSITLSTPQDIATSSTPTFASQTLSSATNQLTLGNGTTTTISALAPAANRTATIPALSANDIFVLQAQAQTLTNKTIGATGLTFSGAGTDITTGTGEDFTISPNGAGEIILSNIVQLGSLPASGANPVTTICRDNTTHEVIQCPANAAAVTLQQAYDSGNTLLTTTGRNIDFTLDSGLGSPTSFTLTNNGNATAFALTNAGTGSAILINDTNGGTNNALVVESGGTPKLTINELGVLSTSGSISTTGSGSISSATTLTAQATTNQLVLGTTNTTTITSIAPAAPRVATLPALTADDTFVFANQAQTLANKTIGSTGLVFSGASTDITTGTNENFTISPDGAGQIVLSSLTQIPTLGANTGAVGICRNSSNQISSCGPNPDSVTLQQAYGAGNTIATTTGRNIAFTLYDQSSDSGVATSFSLANAGTAPAFIINDTNGATNTNFEIQSNSVNKLTINENGILSLAGNGAADITTLSGGNALTLQPASNGTNSVSGGALNLYAGNESGTTSTGGAVNIQAGTGTSANGAINIGTSNTASISIGANGILTTNNGSFTSTQTLTASNGLTLTTGALNLTGTSGALTISGLTASSIATAGGADINFTSGHFNTTATGINNTAIGATTASTGAFTTLSSTGNTTLASGAGAVTTIGNSSGTFQVIGSNLNISTAGVITLAGSQAPDITTAVAATATNIGVKPGNSTAATGTGAGVTIAAGDQTGNTSGTGGTLTLAGGNATGAGTTTGGNVSIDAGTGSTNNGSINIGTTNALALALGNATSPITLNGSTTVAANKNLTLSSGTGTFTQTYANSSTTAGNFTPASIASTLSGIFTAGTTNLYGLRSDANVTGVSTGGNQNAYGGYFTATGENTGAGTSQAAGLYATASSADVNYAAIFDQGFVKVNTLGGNTGATILCINASNQLSSCQNNSNGVTLQQAYENGNTIVTTTGRDIAFSLYDESSNSGTATSFTLTNSGTANALVVNNLNAANSLNFVSQDGGVNTLTIRQDGRLALAGGLSPDITTLTGGNALTLQPAVNNTGSGTGGALNLNAGNESGATSTGGSVNILAGTGTSNNGAINIGTSNTASISIGANGILTTNNGSFTSTQTLTASNGFTQTTGALSLTATSGAITISGLSASSIATSGGADFNFTTGHFNTTSTGINNTAIGATTAAAGTFTNLTSTGTTTLSSGAGNNTTIGNTTGTFQVIGSNLNISTAGVITLAGSQAPDITTAVAATATNIGVKPGDSTAATGTGAGVTIAAGNQTGATSGTGGTLTLAGGNATGIGTANGGNVVINAGTGGTANGTISIGTTTASALSLGNASGTFSLVSSGGLNVTTAGALTGVASIDTISTSATALGFAGAGTITSTGANTLTLDSGTTGNVNLGTGNNAKTINIGTGTAGNSINIGTDNSALTQSPSDQLWTQSPLQEP